MKRVIDGVTYNTDTATVVARWDYRDFDGLDTDATLYQTRGGAFFAVHEWEVPDRDCGVPRRKVWFEAMQRDRVEHLIEYAKNLAIVAPDILGEPPEAEAEKTPGATLYIRVPASLKAQIETAASEARLSVNAWAMRCLESGLAGRRHLQPAASE